MQEKYSKAVVVMRDFKDLLNNIGSIKNQCNMEIKECDQAICDARHYCELDYPTNRKDRTRVCQILRDYSKRRRIAKDTLDVLNPLDEWCNTHRIANDISRIANEMGKIATHIESNRTYRPRILEELFKKSIEKQ